MRVAIYRVPNIWVRFCLHFEWMGLPMGAGGFAGSISFMTRHFEDVGFWHWFSIAWTLLFVLLLIIGLVRPMHRKLGFQRNTLWTK